MKRPLNIVITSGGTVVPIDKVRCLTNYSEGTTGALIAQQALEAGHNVRYLCSKNARTPYGTDLAVRPERGQQVDKEVELARLAAAISKYNAVADRLSVEPNRSFDEYRQQLLTAVADPTTDVAILSMAASDYGPAPVEGKIASDKETLVLALERLPKIISQVKKTRREIFLVGFKFLMGETPDKLIETAYRSLLRDGQDLAVANVAADEMKPDQMRTYLVTLERGVIPIQRRQDLPRVLMETIENRYSTRHYRTEHERVDSLPLLPEEVRNFLEDIHRLSRLALFNQYLEGDRRQFGFVAKRTEKGTLVTSRGSAKKNATVDDLAIITDMDRAERKMSVTSTKDKASLNGNVAHMIFTSCPDVQYILHAHIPLPHATRTEAETTPGTEEDVESVERLVQAGQRVIFQPNHGIIVLLSDLDEVVPLLQQNGIYGSKPELYDLAYSRFQKNTRFTDLISEELPVDADILDLAAGTGEVSLALQKRGYSKLTLADPSEPMLDIARSKFTDAPPKQCIVTSMEELDAEDAYDGIVIRQAINYLTPETLGPAFSRMYRALRKGGKLIFNSFTVQEGDTPAERNVRDETETHVLLTQEGNLVERDTIHHGQRTEIFNKQSGDFDVVYDLNSFHILTEDQFTEGLRAAGFINVSIRREGKSLYVVCTKD